jgi:hypothetical protein
MGFGMVGQPATEGLADAGRRTIRVEEINGVWWFVQPDGKRFFSLGVNCVQPGISRAQYDPAKPAYAATRFYDSTDSWAKDALERLQAWKFNTIGGWSDPAVTNGPLPHVTVLHLGSQLGVPWNDLFANDFPRRIEKLVEQNVAPRQDDPNLLGWFTDNELGWYPDTLFMFHLAQPAESKTRHRLVKLLREHYQDDFRALERDFTTPDVNSFDQLAVGGTLRARPGRRARQVVLEFTALLATRYYQVMNQAIRRVDTSHLILGDRYASNCPDVVAKAAGPFVDVISTNYDWPAAIDGYLPTHYLRRLHELSGRPVLITEYYVAAAENRSGNRNSGNIFTTVKTQRERATAFEYRLRQLAAEPYVVGAHWFCFADEPTHGRPADGEDYNFGLIDIENRPYEELTAAMTDLHKQGGSMHAATPAVNEPRGGSPQIIPAADRLPLLAIGNWDKRGVILPRPDATCAADLLACWDSEHLYVAVLGLRYIDEQLYAAEAIHDSERMRLAIEPSGVGRPIQIHFGSKTDLSLEGGQIDCRAWQEGVRYTVIAAVPAAMFGKPRMAAGDKIELRTSLHDVRDNTSVRWNAALQLE